MSTHAQIAANKANAQHSIGPRTEQGKAASSKNHLKFGFTGMFVVLPWEKQEEFDALTKSLNDQHQPTTDFETDLVQKMARHYWLSQRALQLQEVCFHSDAPTYNEFFDKDLALYMRYQTTHERAFERCANELRKLRNECRKTEIGFESQERKRKGEARKEADEARKQANENRKKERHEFALLLDQAKLTHQQPLTRTAELAQPVAAIAEQDRLKAQKAA